MKNMVAVAEIEIDGKKFLINLEDGSHLPKGFLNEETTNKEVAEMLFNSDYIPKEKWIVPFDKNNINTKDGIADFLYLNSGSTGRMKLFLDIKKHLINPEVYWLGLACAYVGGDNHFKYNNEIRKCFTSNKPNKESLMDDEERKYLDNLPNKVKVYRAMSIDEYNTKEYGISWTTKRSVALFFRDKYFRNFDTVGKKKVIKEMWIDKKDIIAFFNSRNEFEIIYIKL